MSDDDLADKIQKNTSTVIELVKSVTSTPEGHKAAKNLGKTAVILTETINNCLLPLVGINIGINKSIDKAKDYFANRFSKDLSQTMAHIPLEHRIEPKLLLAGPTMQGLAYTHEEPNLKEMYLNLLATAMDNRVADNAHPAFVEIIKQLNSEEAHYLSAMLREPSQEEVVQIHAVHHEFDKGRILLFQHLFEFINTDTGEIFWHSNLELMMSNWLRLRLIEISYTEFLADPNAYAWVEKHPIYLTLKKTHDNDIQKVRFTKGMLKITSFGKEFAKAVGITDSNRNQLATLS